jgi:uncharacterized SAM-binding protein YcdF (DUF218 family)
MFFYLSKILNFLISPFTWFIVLVLIARFTKNPERKRKWWVASFIILLFFSNPFLSNQVMKNWEMTPVSINSIHEPYDIGILLGGSLRSYDVDYSRPIYSQSVDRLLQTIALYKSGKIKKILLSGGSGSVTRPDERESEIILKVIEQTGIPSKDIIVENSSRNTYENAVYSAEILKTEYPNGKFLLITSSFHMRRSLACFNKTGLRTSAFPVDPRANTNIYTPENTIFPNAGAILMWDALIHEWLGILSYKLAGYI